MSKKSVWNDNRFWQRSAAWVTGMAVFLLIWLTFDTSAQISMGLEKDLQEGIAKRVPSPSVINHKITYEMDNKRRHEVPVIGEKELFFGRDDYSEEEARELVSLGKMSSQTRNCMNCHTLLGNGAYYAPDLTKAWLDPAWQTTGHMIVLTGKATKEEAMSEFLQNPYKYRNHKRAMPNLGIEPDEAKALVAFLKHMSSIDTNGFPRNFGKIEGAVHGK